MAKCICRCLCLVLLSSVALAEDAPVDTLEILIPTSILNDFNRFRAGRDILSIDDYGSVGSRREVAELVLLYQALYLGGFHGEVKFITQEVDYLRSLKMLGDGQAAIYGTTVWKENVSGDNSPFLISDPLVREGEFIVGLYTSPDNDRALAVRSLDDLKTLRAVTNQNWSTDWRSLNAVELARLYHVQRWASMARMVRAGRADFTLAPFRAGAGRLLASEDFVLVPIPNTSFVLQGSRHWVTSRLHPDGERAYRYLQAGLKSLRNQGTVARAYRQSGFFQAADDYWPPINSAQMTGSQLATRR